MAASVILGGSGGWGTSSAPGGVNVCIPSANMAKDTSSPSEASLSCVALLRELPIIVRHGQPQGSRSDDSQGADSDLLPNLLGRSLIARFKRVSKHQSKVTGDGPRWRTTPAPHVAGTSSWPAKGNVGLYVRYPEECYRFPEIVDMYAQSGPSLGDDRGTLTQSAPLVLPWSQPDAPAEPVVVERLPRNPTKDAIQVARKMRQKSMSDALAGMSKEFLADQPKLKLVYGETRRQSRGISFSAPVKKGTKPLNSRRDSRAGSGSKKMKPIPGRYEFPRESDFIVRDQKLDGAPGMDWSVIKTESIGRKKETTFYMPTKATGPGKLCRNFYPVTEALHKHGTSVTKLKAKVLGKGDWHVKKVWNRSSSRMDHPSLMAKEDIDLREKDAEALPVKHDSTHMSFDRNDFAGFDSDRPSLRRHNTAISLADDHIHENNNDHLGDNDIPCIENEATLQIDCNESNDKQTQVSVHEEEVD